MKAKMNSILYILFGIFFIVVAFVVEVYMLIFMGLCLIVLGITGGNNFTKLFEKGLFREGLFKKKDNK